MTLGSIVVRLTANTASFETDLGRAAQATKRRTQEIDAAFRKSAIAIGTALGVAAVGLAKVVRNTIEAEKVQAQLMARIADTGSAAGRSLEQLNTQAEKLQGLTIFDDETIGEAQAMLLTFKQIQGVQFDKTIESSLDLATVMGTDASDAAKLLGKALADPEKGMSALSRAGVVFTEAEREAVKEMAAMGDMAGAQDKILAKLEGTMGSAAEAARNTFGGALQGLSNAFDNLLEGDTGSDGVRGTVDAVNNLTDTLNDPDVRAGFQNMISGAASLTAELLNGIGAMERLAEQYSTLSDIREKRAAGVPASAYSDRELQNTIALLGQGKRKAIENGDSALVQKLQAEITALIREDSRRNREAARLGDWQEGRITIGAGWAGVNGRPSAGGAPATPRASGGGRSSGSSARGRQQMPDFMREDQDALARMVEQASAANEQFERLAATLGGPLAEAEFEHQQSLQRMTELGIEAGRSTAEIDALKQKETERYNEQRAAIEATLNPMQQLLDAQQAELDMLGLGNTERQMMNALRAQGIDLLGDEARAYMANAKAMDQQEKRFGLQIDVMDAFRQEGSDFLQALAGGEKPVDALTDALDGLAAKLRQMIADNLMDQFFGPQSSTGAGTSGGNWLGGLIGALFGGGGGYSYSSAGVTGSEFASAFEGFMGGGGWARGGWTGPGGMNEYAGPAHREEVIWSKGDVARAGGVGAVESMRRGQRGAGGQYVQNLTFHLAAPTDTRTQSQVAERAGSAIQRAMRRNG